MKNQYEARSSMFWTLFRYINGANHRNLEVDVTAPILIVFENTVNSQTINKDSETITTMKLYLPKINQVDTPIPTNSNVTISEEAPMEVAVVSFGGWAYYSDYINYGDKLIKNLGAEAHKYDHNNIIFAAYDYPISFNLIGRKNEIWLRKVE